MCILAMAVPYHICSIHMYACIFNNCNTKLFSNCPYISAQFTYIHMHIHVYVHSVLELLGCPIIFHTSKMIVHVHVCGSVIDIIWLVFR